MTRNDAKFQPAFTTEDKFFFDDPIFGISRRAWLQSLFAAPFVAAARRRQGPTPTLPTRARQARMALTATAPV